jgi:lysyl-tRNA synthetase class 2
MLAAARDFFSKRGLIEADVGALVKYPPNDSHIQCIAHDQDNGYLHTSPEYAMKRLLSQGVGDCYFLGHVYRKSELGHLHNPEFTMAEWYRIGIHFSDMIQEACDFLSLFFGPLPIQTISYRKAFEIYAGINYSTISLSELQKMAQNRWPRQVCLHYLLSHTIEPKFDSRSLTVLTDYPASEAALACTREKNGEIVAERFEIYYRGVELCNGYHELSDAKELRRRFHEQNKERKEPYPIDEKFLASLKNLPDCCGVALGFDRAFMLQQKLPSIKQVLPFAWDEL